MIYENKPIVVREVWASNMSHEFALLQKILPRYRFASIDMEFPGVIYTANVENHVYSNLSPSCNYQLMKTNVDALKMIQIGLTLSNYSGDFPNFGTQSSYLWQFNLKDFDIEYDLCNPESIRVLKEHGIDFSQNKQEGIPSWAFRKFLLISGLLSNRSPLTWVTFHGCYDFGFMIKLLTARELPPHVDAFRYQVAQFFGPRVFDIKHMIKFCNGLYGGLETVAKTLKVGRVVGKRHQAGSDSLLTMQIFMKLKDVYFSGDCGEQFMKLMKFQGVLYGFEVKEPSLCPPLHKNTKLMQPPLSLPLNQSHSDSHAHHSHETMPKHPCLSLLQPKHSFSTLTLAIHARPRTTTTHAPHDPETSQ